MNVVTYLSYFSFLELKKYVAKLTTEEQKLLPEKCDIELNYKTATEKFNEVNAIIHQWRAKVMKNTISFFFNNEYFSFSN